MVYIVLFMHVNTYMFFPMIDEQDVYEASGVQKDDINSLIEYIDQVVLGHHDDTPEDEDDDQAHFYHLKAPVSYVVNTEAQMPVINGAPFEIPVVVKYGTDAVPQIRDGVHDIITPPPDNC